MAFRTRYRRKAPSSPESQRVFFNKAAATPAFFDPSRSTTTPVVQRQEATSSTTKPEEEPVQKQVKEEDKPIQKQAQEEEKPIQKQVEEDKPIQKQTQDEEKPVQKQEREEEKPVQKQVKEDEKPVQKQNNPNEAQPNKAKASSYRVSSTIEEPHDPACLPDHLKVGIEALTGISMNDVKVHYNSPKPAHMNALAYTQGTDIYLAPGQEKHLPHEAWHVVQQKQGRVSPTVQTKGVGVNDDSSLEQEATVMGQKANEPSTPNPQSSNP